MDFVTFLHKNLVKIVFIVHILQYLSIYCGATVAHQLFVTMLLAKAHAFS